MEHSTSSTGPDLGLDRDLILQLKKRFLTISEERLARTRLGFNDRQQLVLDTLPALFHFNHPGLPGYVSHQTPCGLSQFKVRNRTRLAIKRLSRSFNVNDPSHREPDIYAIFIMGSVGSVAHGSRSDLDVWVCYKPGLCAAQVQLLHHKGERIARWALTQGLEMHCFPMDCAAFKAGQAELLDDESSGSSQHFLLLDEFYRTAIWLGGRLPLWWFVPPEGEHDYEHYAQALVKNQFIRSKEVLDFGSAAEIPPGEFIGAGIWHLYKGIDSPYKSVLKLLLLEVYASRYPDSEPLSVNFKRQVYAGETRLDVLDAYVCLYRLLEAYLIEREEPKRLELVRRAFYFKVNCPLTRNANGQSWQGQLLKGLVQQWSWSQPHVRHLDERKTWKAAQVKLEKHMLVYELISSYRFLSNFSHQVGAKNQMDQQELEILGHKLHAAFDRKAGKIEWVNPEISADLSEAFLLIRHRPWQNTNEQWAVYALPTRHSSSHRNWLLKHSRHLNELLCWCLFNRVYGDGTEIMVDAGRLKSQHIKQFFSAISACIPIPLPKPKHEDFVSQARVLRVVVFANLHADDDPDQSLRIPANRNAFCYGEAKTNLINSIEWVALNSWSEVMCQSFDDQPLQTLAQRYLQLCQSAPDQSEPEISIFCGRSRHSSLITARLHEMFSDLNQSLQRLREQRAKMGLHFVFEADTRWHLLHSDGHKTLLDSYATESQLHEGLQKPHGYPTLWALDSRALVNSPLRLALNHSLQPGIKVFVALLAESNNNYSHATLYFVDDRQNLSILKFPYDRLTSLMQSLHHFIRRIVRQGIATHCDLNHSFGVYPVTFFQLRRLGTRWSHCEPISIDAQMPGRGHFEVKAIAEGSDGDDISYRLICDQHECSGSLPEQIRTAAEFIRSRRRGGNYPCYLSDLDLSHCRDQLSDGGQLLLGHFLRIKLQLENRINAEQNRL